MDLRKIIFPLHKWWWLIILSTVVAAAASFLATRGQPIVYQARTTLMIGGTINDPNPSSSEFFLGEQLATAYADIANRELVRQATMGALGMRRLPEYIARALPKTQIMEIIVTDQDPQRAQTVANELATQLIALSPTNLDPEEQARLDAEEAQRKQVEAEANAQRQAEEAAARSAEQERQRIAAQQQAAQEEADRRAADIENRRTINAAAVTAIMLAADVDPEQARMVVEAIARGKIPNVSISY